MSPPGPIRVLIADDHALFREGLALLLALEPDIRVVGQAADGLETLRMAETLQPDILLLDIRMPEADGLAAVPKVLKRSPKTKILIVSGFLEEDLLVEALQHGAKGFIAKTSTHSDLVKAIRAAHAGEIWAGRRALAQLLESLLQRANGLQGSLSATRSILTDREHEVVQYVIQGMTNKEIAPKLNVSEKTVKTHLSNIFRKMKVSRRVELLLYRFVTPAD